MHDPTSSTFFEEKYLTSDDPWQFATSSYELGRYAATLHALNGRRFQKTVEPGCSIGVLTERLAEISDRVEASDISPTAVARAQKRCQHLRNVRISLAPLDEALVQDSIDLFVLSEIGYYFPEARLKSLAQHILMRIEPGGVFLAVHWLGQSEDHLLSGEHVHKILFELHGISHEYTEHRESFWLDRWRRL